MGEKLTFEQQLFYDHLKEQYDPFYKKDKDKLRNLREKLQSQKITPEEKQLLYILEIDLDNIKIEAIK